MAVKIIFRTPTSPYRIEKPIGLLNKPPSRSQKNLLGHNLLCRFMQNERPNHAKSRAPLYFAHKKPGEWPGRFGLPKDGARGRIRTTDTRIFSPLLYQLSYPGIL